ncbi:hypothetical protein B0H16DRAFT_1449251 [Mycena metata]|uniref:Uncharacterized protein n=1 Tax=Mycena metata TaxID=1033252 RepID=A0AAD7K2Y8_9AGAR|nr:hypothetical protein B0H16DRAFT_1449251 [Mycena metata]
MYARTRAPLRLFRARRALRIFFLFIPPGLRQRSRSVPELHRRCRAENGLSLTYLRFRAAEVELDESASGWGDVHQELLLNVELANRAFVADDYTWARDGGPYAQYDYSVSNGTRRFKVVPARIPRSAPRRSPRIPRQFSRTHPRAVSRAAFPRTSSPLALLRLTPTVPVSALRKKAGGSCKRLLSIWPALRVSSPVSAGRISLRRPHAKRTIFPYITGAPRLVCAGISVTGGAQTSRKDVGGCPCPSHLPSILPTRPHPNAHTLTHTHVAPTPGILALLAAHCTHLANWARSSMGLIGSMRRDWMTSSTEEEEEEAGGPWGDEERFLRPEGGVPPSANSTFSFTMPANRARYLGAALVFPPIHQIIEKVRRVYVMTNADPAWLAELEAALRDARVDGRVQAARHNMPQSDRRSRHRKDAGTINI